MIRRSFGLLVSALLVASPVSFATPLLTVDSSAMLSAAQFADLPAPVAQNLAITVPFDTARAITLTATHSGDAGALVYTIKSAPAHGTLSVAVGGTTNGTVTYTPAPGYAGPDAFTYSATDDVGESLDATVSITVQPIVAAVVAPLPTLGEWAMVFLVGLLGAVAYRQRRREPR